MTRNIYTLLKNRLTVEKTNVSFALELSESNNTDVYLHRNFRRVRFDGSEWSVVVYDDVHDREITLKGDHDILWVKVRAELQRIERERARIVRGDRKLTFVFRWGRK